MNVMVDIETLGVKPGCVILTLGAKTFSRNTGSVPDSSFYKKIDRQSCLDIGLVIEENSLNWWNKFPDDNPAKIEALIDTQDRLPIDSVLLEFNKWFFQNNCKYVWANSPNFDMVLLEHVYDKLKIPVPWKYFNFRDVRTLEELTSRMKYFGEDIKVMKSNNHNALADCENQIMRVKLFFKYWNAIYD